MDVYFFQLKMLLSRNKFCGCCNFYCFYAVRTGLFRKNKEFLQKKSNVGLFGGENSIFSRWAFAMDFCWWLKPEWLPTLVIIVLLIETWNDDFWTFSLPVHWCHPAACHQRICAYHLWTHGYNNMVTTFSILIWILFKSTFLKMH